MNPPRRAAAVVVLPVLLSAASRCTPMDAPPAEEPAPYSYPVQPYASAPRSVGASPAGYPADPPSEGIALEPALAPPAPSPCAGEELHAASLLASGSCSPAGPPRVLAPEQAFLLLTPASLTVSPGATLDFDVAVFNRTELPITVDLAMCPTPVVATVILEESSADANCDALHDSAEFGVLDSSCGPGVRVTVQPKGRAHLPASVTASHAAYGKKCRSGKSKPLAPGAYKLRVRVPMGEPFRGPTFTTFTTLTVAK